MELTNATARQGESPGTGRWNSEAHTTPPNLIPADAASIAPQMLTMVHMDQEQIDRITRAVPNGASNVKDIYPLSGLQEGMLFHHLLDERSDTYVLAALLEVQSHAHAVELAGGLQKVIDRHDALRSAVLWEDLPQPIQVVYRQAALPVEEVILQPGQDPVEHLRERMAAERRPFDLRRAPLLRMLIAQDAACGRCNVLIQRHHIVFDHRSWNIAFAEAVACANGHERQLAEPLSYRDYVAWSRARSAPHAAEAFFGGKLKDLEEPSAPFGVLELAPDGADTEEASDVLDLALVERIRGQARSLGVSVARLFHAAWGVVVARTSGRNDVVYGTVLSGNRSQNLQQSPMVGLFVNTLPLRLQLEECNVSQLVTRTHAELTELLDYQQVPATLAQRCSGIDLPAPLFTAVLNYRHSAGHSIVDHRTADAAGIRVLAQRYRTNYPIMLVVDDLADAIKLTAQTDRRIDPQRIVGYMKVALSSLIEALAHAPATPARELSVMPADEWHQVIRTFNTTLQHFPQHLLVHELVERQVQRTPDVPAVTHGERSLSYRELNRKANMLARHLVASGVRPDQPVAILADRSVEMVVGILGILKAGGAYVPLDPNYPSERLQYMVDDCNPHVVLTSAALSGALPRTRATVFTLDDLLRQMPDEAMGNLSAAEVGLSDGNLAYVIYTSGTTGRPKGTTMPHRAMVNLLEWHRRDPQLGIVRRVLQFAALSFDVAFQEIFSTLCSGSTLVLLDEWIRRDARALAAFLSQQRIERLFVPPLMLQSLAEHARNSGDVPQALRDVITAGEQLRISPEIVGFFRRLSGCRLHNHYGPTETHVVTALTLAGDLQSWPAVPTIGQPIANTQVYILDERLAATPLGVVGEIYLGGANVARGYLDRPELTAQRFLRDPFSSDPQSLMYKTGDLGRWRVDGTIDYLGRNDDQVKIRGFRIELGEVEAQLARHNEVREAAVVVREDVPGEKRLVAYLTLRGSIAPGSDELRKHMQLSLPDHMVPGAFVVLQSLPLTPTGKLNRRALPAPALDAYASRPYVAPKGEVEEILAGIWHDLLGVERVGRDDNFFELGGHSLLLVQMMERLRRTSLSASVRSIYESRTLAALACALVGQDADGLVVPPNLIPAGAAAITPQMLPLVELDSAQIERILQRVPGGATNVQDIYPLAPLQDGMLFHHLFNEHGGDAYIVSMLFSMSSRAAVSELLDALQNVIDRHDILRTAVLWEDLPCAVQVVHRRALLPVEEFSLDPHRDVRAQLSECMRPERQQMDIRQAPLMRLRVTADPRSKECYAILQLHHLLGDHESLDTMLMEVTACLKGLAGTLPEAKPYRLHVAQALAPGQSHEAEKFFRSKLAEVDEPTAPFGLLDVHGDGGRVDRVVQPLESSLARRLRARARCCGVSAATLFHAAWALVVAMTSGRSDVVFGTVLLGRLHGSAGAHRILGLFMNTLPLRIKLQGLTAAELIERTQIELVDLLGHEQASLAVAQRCSGVVGRAPLFNALLNYRWSTVDLDMELSSAGLKRLEVQSYTNYPLMFSVLDRGDSFLLETQTDRRIDTQRMMGYVMTAIGSLVEALDQGSERPALTLPVVPHDERRLIASFNDSHSPYPSDQLIHELFEEQARRTPHVTAVVYAGRSLTYAELNARANKLARHLRSAGVVPDDIVGLYAERSLEMIVGLLATLKSGGAYLPLDPSHPVDRLAYMLTDASPRVLLVQEALKGKVPATPAMIIDLDRDWSEIDEHLGSDLHLRPSGLCSRHLAYIIYTSGSTGRPKGVMIEHANVLNLWHGLERLYGPASSTSQRIALNASISFDASVQQIVHLLSGRTLHIIPQEYRLDAAAMVRFLTEQRIEGLDCTPSQLKSWIAAGLLSSGRQCGLRLVLIGGEAIDGALWTVLAQTPGLDFFNVYGPTECTVDATAAHVDAAATPHIGSPMANRRIYILSDQGQPVPLGSTGEIHIGGAGVGRGYLNRPEITAERFIVDPFSVDPAARMYRTGDLGRWRSDGTVEYIGRNDDQVKVRGYRIELGEIELTLAAHGRVKDAVVVVRADASGQNALVAYVVPQDPVCAAPVEDLRAHLKAALPEYMVPSAFVTIERLPSTSSGKIDRRALPAPDAESYFSKQYEEPVGEVERALADVWQSVLSAQRIGRHDNFFDLGCHSLLVLKALFSINRTLGSSLKVADIYKCPTVRDLAARISGQAIDDELVDLSKEATLDPRIVALPGAPRTHAQGILLTGASGFVGRFLLAQLLLETDATLYCLVRAQSGHDASLRIKSILAEWDLWREEFEPRIVGIAGDLRAPRLGIDDAVYEGLCREVDSIYHCATSMNHLETYAMAKPANVQSASELLRLATTTRPKVVNYISTLGVFSSRSAAAPRVVDETTAIESEQHRSSLGYAASKWVGEKVFLNAQARGIACNILRLGLVWPDSRQGRYDELQRDYRVIKTCLLIGYGIQGYRYETAPIPVDYAARAIVFLTTRHSNGKGIFHIASPAQPVSDLFERCNEACGTSLKLLSYYDWICEVKRLHLAGRSLPVLPLVEFAFSMSESSFHEHQRRARATRVHVSCVRTQRELEAGGISVPAFDDDLLRSYLDGMLTRDGELREAIYLPEPLSPVRQAAAALRLQL
jgi:amino acid adenylation domain-containing protein/thioester reductase-like protein